MKSICSLAATPPMIDSGSECGSEFLCSQSSQLFSHLIHQSICLVPTCHESTLLALHGHPQESSRNRLVDRTSSGLDGQWSQVLRSSSRR